MTAWEWLDSYCLRNLLYPAFLSIPLHVLRALDLDYNLAVVCAPLIMNALLQAIGDVYGYAFVKKFLGKTTAQVFFAYSFFNHTTVLITQRTMTNGAEVTCCLAAFYHFGNLNYHKKTGVLRCDREMVAMTAAITFGFLIRSSSLIGWLPLALFAIFATKNLFGNLFTIIWAGLTVTLPLLVLSFLLDSAYYGKFTLTQYNFLYVNIVLDVSSAFGVEPSTFYLKELENRLRGFGRFELTLLGLAMLIVYQSFG